MQGLGGLFIRILSSAEEVPEFGVKIECLLEPFLAAVAATCAIHATVAVAANNFVVSENERSGGLGPGMAEFHLMWLGAKVFECEFRSGASCHEFLKLKVDLPGAATTGILRIGALAQDAGGGSFLEGLGGDGEWAGLFGGETAVPRAGWANGLEVSGANDAKDSATLGHGDEAALPRKPLPLGFELLA